MAGSLSVAQRRRWQLVFRVVGIVAVLSTVVTVRQTVADADTVAGDPSRLQPAVDVDPAPDVFETTLVAQAATIDLGGGLLANTWTYNGTVPGPEIRVRVGDTLVVHFENRLPVASSIHWHGIELNNASDGTELTQNAVRPGQRFLYRFTVPRPGIFWYHPHHNATNPVFKGQYGSLIVEDRHDDTLVANGVLPSRDRTRTLLLSDTTVCKDPGTNDFDTYDDSLPWAGGGPLPHQPGPSPSTLCDTPRDEHGKKIVDANGRPVPLPRGAIPNIQIPFGTSGRTNEGQTVLVNGRNPGHRDGTPEAPGPLASGAAVVDVPAGQAIRLQAINAAVVRYFRLRMTDDAGRHIPLVRVGGEGGLLDEARLEGGVLTSTVGAAFDLEYRQGELVLGPSDRADFVVPIPADAPLGVATLWTLDYARTGDGFAFIPTVPVMHLNITAPEGEPYTIAPGDDLRTHPAVGDPVEQLGEPILVPGVGSDATPLLDPATFTPRKQGSAEEDINLTITINAPSIDNVPGQHHTDAVDYTASPHTVTSRYARIGDTLELVVVNRTAAHHPFHLHGFSFQPLTFERNIDTGTANVAFNYHQFGYREFVDTFDIPNGFAMRFRVRIDDRPLMDGTTPGGGLGRWMMHCHIFFHGSLGMHTELVIVAPDGNEKPAVDADTPSTAVVEGGVATASGRYVDPDGDPVVLSASSGQVTDLGGGRWAWQGSAAATGDETVYVTATDSRGLRGQAAFDVEVANVPPDVAVIDPPSGAAFPLGTPVTVTASAVDPNPDDVVVCRFDWDDGLGLGSPVHAVDGRCAQSRTPARAGVYTVTVSASDGDGGVDVDRTVVAVYDPAAGSVTGSGAVASPPGAYAGAPAVGGPATFDLVAKYKDRTGTPAGSLAFAYAVGPFDFRATGYDWLVVAGPKAQARGMGAVGGVGGHRFLLTVSDAPDGFRLQVWDAAGAAVYDNARGAPDDIDAFAPPPITAGSIVFHR